MNSQTPASRTNEKQSNQATPPAKPASQSRKAKSSDDSQMSEPSQQKSEQPKPNRFDKIGSAQGFQLNQPKSGSSSQQQKEVTFKFEAPAAREVLLAADFTNWDKQPIKLIKGGGGTWHAKLSLSPGRHLYKFLVDGEWRDDPNCPSRVPNPYGSANSVVEIS